MVHFAYISRTKIPARAGITSIAVDPLAIFIHPSLCAQSFLRHVLQSDAIEKRVAFSIAIVVFEIYITYAIPR